MRGFADFYYIVVNNTMIKEIWKTVIIDGVENPRYKVSSLGRIICLNWHRTGKPRICRLTKHSDGYLTVSIDRVKKLVHRLVAETFIPNPQNKPEVDHINTIRNDNRVENLKWVTYGENNNNPLSIKNMSENNAMLGKFGAEHNRSIPIVQLTKDGQFIRKWSCAAEVKHELGIDHSNIIQCCLGKRKSAGGYHWMYYSDWVKKTKKPSDINPLF